MILNVTLALMFLFTFVENFNVETRGNTTRILRPHSVEQDADSQNDSSSFFGYALSYLGEGKTSNLLVGSPRANKAKPRTESDSSAILAKGDLHSYPMVDVFSPGYDSRSSSISPSSTPGDSIGLEVDVGTNGNLLVCSPGKMNCLTAFFSPGYCYKSDDEGEEWSIERPVVTFDCRGPTLDLMFVLDGSGSVGIDNFDVIKEWVVNIANQFNENQDDTHIGVVQYSYFDSEKNLDDQELVKTEIELGEIKDINAFSRKVQAIELQGYSTYTAAALNKTVLDFERSERYTDEGVSKVLILLTDGKSDDYEDLSASAEFVRSLNIRTFAVGVGRSEVDELRIIATGNETSDRSVFHVDDFEDLSGIIDELAKEISFALEGSSANLLNASFELELAEAGFSSKFGKSAVSLCDKLKGITFISSKGRKQ